MNVKLKYPRKPLFYVGKHRAPETAYLPQTAPEPFELPAGESLAIVLDEVNDSHALELTA